LDKAVFLDRDGVINVDVHYLNNVNDLKLIDGVKEALKILKDSGYKIYVITNQSGIARGIVNWLDLADIHEVINIITEWKIDRYFVCPHLPDDHCTCRKPNIGMFEQAGLFDSIDIENSYMIGDKAIDILAGYNARLKTIAVKTGYGEIPDYADYIAENLLEAVRDIVCKQQ